MTPDREAMARDLDLILSPWGADDPGRGTHVRLATDRLRAALAEQGLVLVPASEVEALRAAVTLGLRGKVANEWDAGFRSALTRVRAAAPSLFEEGT